MQAKRRGTLGENGNDFGNGSYHNADAGVGRQKYKSGLISVRYIEKILVFARENVRHCLVLLLSVAAR